MDSTGRNPEVEEVLGALSVLLSGGGIGQLQTITHELNEMMEGRTGKIRDVLDQLNTLVGTLDTQRGDIVQAMESINGLSKTLDRREEDHRRRPGRGRARHQGAARPALRAGRDARPSWTSSERSAPA